ncbi:MAG: TolC family protein [Flavobacteriales bacterium]|nr:TolC family protein [Flavobacteriales bacterium]
MRTLLFLFALMLPGAVLGQAENTGSGTRLTLEEAQSLAALRAYNVRYAALDTKEAASSTREIIASGFPQVSGSIEYNRYIDIPTQVSSGDVFGFPDYLTAFLGGVAQATGVPLDAPPSDPNAVQEFQFGAAQTMTAGITATQLIFSPSYFVGIQAAKAYASAMEASESKSVADARRAAGEGYAAALAAKENVAILAAAEALAQNALDQTLALVQEGLAESTDADQLELALSEMAQQRATAESMALVALDALKFTVGMPVETTVILADSFETLSNAFDGASVLGKPFDANRLPEIQSQSKNLELTELGIRNEKAAGMPSIGAFYTNQRNAQRDAFDFFGSGNWYPIQLVGVQMNIPIWSSFGGKEKVLQAQLTRDRAETALEQLTQAATLEYRAARTEYNSSLEQRSQAQRGLDLAERILDRTRIRFQEGLASSFDMTQAQNQLVNAQANLAQATLRWFNAHLRLQRSLNA